MAKKVVTVLGQTAPHDLGITDAHNHIWISSQDIALESAPVLDQESTILDELVLFKEAGGGTQLDCQPGNAGRDGNKLMQLSAKSGVTIIANTGFHLADYYAEGAKIWPMDADQALYYFLDEINQGLEETRGASLVFPGFIKIAVPESLNKSPFPLLEAAAAASIQSGLLIEMHTEKGSDAENFAAYFMNLELPMNRLTICHLDKRPDIGLHKELAQAGCLLEYDTFFRPKYSPEDNLWPMILEMVESGFGGSIACATDLAESSLWQTFGGGPGLAGFVNIIKRRLEEELQDERTVVKLMGSNIANRLAIKH